jgi:spore germination protein YaaH
MLTAFSILSAGSVTLLMSPPAAAFSINAIQFVKVAGSSPIFALQNGTLYNVPNHTMFNALGGNLSHIQSSSSLSGDTLGLPILVPYPSGDLLRVTGQSSVYMVVQGVLRHITTAAIFNQMKLNWNAIQVVPQLMPNWPVGSSLTSALTYWPSGSVIRQAHQSTVYEVMNGSLRHIPSSTLFHQMGYHWNEVQQVTALPDPIGAPIGTPARAYPNGTLLQVAGSPVVCVDESGVLRPIPNPQVLHALGFHFSDVITVPSASGNSIGTAVTSTTIPGNDPTSSPSTTKNVTTSALNNFLSMGYGYYADNEPNGSSSSSYQDLLQHAQQLSVINPVWYYVQPASGGGWTLSNSTTSIPTQNGQSNISVVTQEAHSHHVLVMPSVGIYYNPASGPITTSQEQLTLVQQLVAAVQQNNYDGLTIDFESQGAGGLSLSQASDQYTSFIRQLGTALHGLGKKLMIAVYASPYPSTIYNYAALAPYANWINIMDYPEHNSNSPAGPTQGYSWVKYIVKNALATGVSPSQIILGAAPYGHSWTYTNSGVTGNAYKSNATIHKYVTDNNIVPTWDSREKSIVFTTGSLAQTPPAPLSYNESLSLPAVKNLQAILNIVLLDYANAHNQVVPPMVWADGFYGPVTAQTVTTFQQEFKVAGAQAGVYNSATAQALGQAIAQYHVGQTQWWDQTSRSFADLLKLSVQSNLAGVAVWRLPFETTNNWNTLSSLTTIWHK